MPETQENALEISAEQEGEKQQALEQDNPKENKEEESRDEESRKERHKKNNDARLIRQRNEAREELQRIAQELAYERGKREALEEAIQRGLVGANSSELKRPKIEDFDTDEEYQEALVDYKLAQREKSKKPEPSEPKEPDPKPNNPGEPPLPPYIQESINEMVQQGLEKFDDFRDVVMDPELPITPGIASALAILDNGPDIAYHLANHPSQLNKLAKMGDTKAAKEIAKLAKSFDAKATKAPEPIKPPAGQTGASAGVDPSKMSMDEWVKHRNKKLGLTK